MKQAKTNAMRILESAQVPFEVHAYEGPGGPTDALTVARKLGVAPERLFKTLVARDERGNVCVFCIPAGSELSLKKAAAVAAAKRIELVAVAELPALTGYVRGGCSPLGMKKRYPLYIDDSASLQASILVSAGRIGLQIEVSPTELIRLTEAQTVDLRQS